MSRSLRAQFPMRLLIGSEDCTFLLNNGGTFSNVDPGGYEAASFSIPKDMPQTIRGLPVRLDSGLGVAWEGRVSQIQRSLGSTTQINCEGYAALLKDAAASMIFVDRDLTRWSDPSAHRQAALIGANWQLAGAQLAADPTSNLPSLAQTVTDSWAAPFQPLNESWYDAGPENLVSSIRFEVSNSAFGGSWVVGLGLSSDANATTTEFSPNEGGNALNNGLFTPATPYRFALLQHYPGVTPSGTQGAQYTSYWRKMAVYGNHGLTGVGPIPVGFYPSQIAGWVASQVPGLQAGTIPLTDASGYIIPHLAYYVEVTLDQIINDMAIAQGWHWGAWESSSPLTGNPLARLDFRPRPAPGAFTAFCRRQDCDTLDIREDLSQQYNRAVVEFTDAVGVSGAVIVTTDNPILDQAGIASRTVPFNAGTMDPAAAALFGAEALALTNVQARVAGTADIIAAIDGGTRPPWLLKAGIDRLRIGDLPSTDAFGAMNDVPISRVECSLSETGPATSVEIGSGANLIETLQSRVAAATALAGQGGV